MILIAALAAPATAPTPKYFKPLNENSYPWVAQLTILLKRLVCAEMIAHEDGHNLAFAEFSLVVSAAFSATVLRWQTEVILQFFVQIFVKLVDNTENFCNFVIGNHRFFVL